MIESIDCVIGGFHLYNPVTKRTEPNDEINKLPVELRDSSATVFYTGYCTGESAYQYLNGTLNERIKEFKTGTEISF